MKVKKVVSHATLPTKAHAGDLGYDLYAAEQVSLHAGDTVLISTGIAIQFPEGYGGVIKDRSSVATKMEIFTCNVDGSDMKQITHLGKANWAPCYTPGGKIIFSSN